MTHGRFGHGSDEDRDLPAIFWIDEEHPSEEISEIYGFEKGCDRMLELLFKYFVVFE